LRKQLKSKPQNYRLEDVPVDVSNLGTIAAEEPTVKQVLLR
jgi:hypothetical protein